MQKRKPKAIDSALFVCFGGMSNVGWLTALGGMEAVRELGFDNSAILCLAGLPAEVEAVHERAKSAHHTVAVDGCENQCAGKILKTAAVSVNRHIVLTRDLSIKKAPMKPTPTTPDPAELAGQDQVARVRDAIVDAARDR